MMIHNCQDKLDKGEEGVNYQDGGSGGHRTGRAKQFKCESRPPETWDSADGRGEDDLYTILTRRCSQPLNFKTLVFFTIAELVELALHLDVVDWGGRYVGT